jgi:predicted O-methyltransferase YrrM
MNAVIHEIEQGAFALGPDGERVGIHSGVDAESGRVLRRAIELASPQLGCEVGLAFGVSTLYILEAMKQFGGGRLIGMDPAQHDPTWRGMGLHNIRRAGLSDRYEFHESTSQSVLPRLAAEGKRIQFAFVDGWHTFDHTLVDFFYLDQMMDIGGVLVLDDVGYPALQRLAHFIMTNRAYTYFDGAARPAPSGWRNQLKRRVQRALNPLVRDDRTPSEPTLRLEAPVNSCQLIALQKRDHDRRRFDHFVHF